LLIGIADGSGAPLSFLLNGRERSMSVIAHPSSCFNGEER
jgi:hypothetical protein